MADDMPKLLNDPDWRRVSIENFCTPCVLRAGRSLLSYSAKTDAVLGKSSFLKVPRTEIDAGIMDSCSVVVEFNVLEHGPSHVLSGLETLTMDAFWFGPDFSGPNH